MEGTAFSGTGCAARAQQQLCSWLQGQPRPRSKSHLHCYSLTKNLDGRYEMTACCLWHVSSPSCKIGNCDVPGPGGACRRAARRGACPCASRWAIQGKRRAAHARPPGRPGSRRRGTADPPVPACPAASACAAAAAPCSSRTRAPRPHQEILRMHIDKYVSLSLACEPAVTIMLGSSVGASAEDW